MPLTDTKIKALFANAQRGESVGKESDGGGLNFQNGKYWRLSYRFAGKQKTLALGVYPDVSLKLARTARDKARGLLAQGIDPGEQCKAELPWNSNRRRRASPLKSWLTSGSKRKLSI